MLSRIKWLTFLSLDAPLVAVAWQALFSRESENDLSWYHYLIVFMSVWLGYAADRWFDNRKSNRPRSEQHQFLARHSRFVQIIWIPVLLADVILAFSKLTAGELTRGFALMAASLAYTFFAQRCRHIPGYPLLKSLLTAFLIMASATLFLPAESISQTSTLLCLVAIWLLFASNCLFIRAWTRESEPRSGRLAHLLAIGSALISVIVFWTPMKLVGAAAVIALVGIVSLNVLRIRVPNQPRRTLADICLLSPLLVILLT
ncbi:hypothetical protein VDG1235_4443 [Verrucomicrobiia bacterium DG1235]|nr:hypothetical protein VDG1235_4443 [Verrucomicrobiae bacterium DG1235]